MLQFTKTDNILFRPKYEELLHKSLSSKNKSKELDGSIKNQGLSNDGNRKQPF